MIGEAVYRKYGVSGTPFLLFLDGNGKEVDWIRGYSAPPEKFHGVTDVEWRYRHRYGP